MRFLATISCFFICFSSAAQQLNLTSLQHEIRWLDEMSFAPFANDSVTSHKMLAYTSAAMARKFNAEPGTIPAKVDYRMINMFGKPKFASPGKSTDPNNYQASVLSFITRGTTSFEVFWEMKVEVTQNGKTIYNRQTRHQLVNYDAGWFDDSSFLVHYSALVDELLELSAPLAEKYVLGKGIDYADQLRKHALTWPVNKNADLLGFGRPSFGPYTTLGAGKLDSPVTRLRQVMGTSSGVTFYSDKTVSFDQFKTIDFTKKKICFLDLGFGTDTLEAVYSVNTHTVEQRRTFLSDLLTNDDENNRSTNYSNRNLIGVIRTDTTGWQFLIESYGSDGSIAGGYLTNSQQFFRLRYNYIKGLHWEFILMNEAGDYLASLNIKSSDPYLLIRNDLDAETTHAFALLYAVLMSARNVQ